MNKTKRFKLENIKISELTLNDAVSKSTQHKDIYSSKFNLLGINKLRTKQIKYT